MSPRLKKPLRRETRGSAAMEFALIAPVFILMLMGLMDLGHGMYVRSVLQGAVQKAGRDSSLQSGVANATTIDATVAAVVQKAAPGATLTYTRRAYSDFSNVATAEPFVDSNGNGTRNAGECYQDINGNGVWDTDSSKTGQGGAYAAAVYTATVTYTHLFPVVSMLGFPSTSTITSSTMLRNQPYDSQIQPTIICT